MYKRITQDIWEIQGNYSNSFEMVTTEESRKEAKERLKEYRENERGIFFRIIKKRIKK